MRFHDEMTQANIAIAIGVSQMHVSRLLKQALSQLRSRLAADDVASHS
jgi:RNA polymerase sigma-B factor